MHGPTAMIDSASQHAPAAINGYTWRITLVAALGGLLFGYDWVVIGGARHFLEVYFQLESAAAVGWANSCALAGCFVGAIASGSLGSRYGRKPVLLISAVLFAVSSILTGWAFSFASFIVWRIAGGIAIGLCTNVSPVYIAEVSPAEHRGRLVSFNQFAIVIGILVAQVVNWLIARPVPEAASNAALLASWNVQHGWRWMFTAVAVPSVIFLLALLGIPESPRWLLTRGRNDEAVEIFGRIDGSGVLAEQEVESIRQSLAAEPGDKAQWGSLLRGGTRRMLLIGIALATLQQWSGIAILFSYAEEIFRSAGLGANQIFVDIVVTGAINLIFTILAIVFVDRLGRRPLMLAGCVTIALSYILAAFALRAGWHGIPVLVLVLCSIAFYAMTLAPLTWVLISEIFPNKVRSLGVSVAVSALWVSAFGVTYTFPFIQRSAGTAGSFFLYGGVCLAGAVFVALAVPETKGRTLEEIEAQSR